MAGMVTITDAEGRTHTVPLLIGRPASPPTSNDTIGQEAACVGNFLQVRERVCANCANCRPKGPSEKKTCGNPGNLAVGIKHSIKKSDNFFVLGKTIKADQKESVASATNDAADCENKSAENNLSAGKMAPATDVPGVTPLPKVNNTNGEKVGKMEPTETNKRGDCKLASASTSSNQKATEPLKKIQKTAEKTAMKVSALAADTAAKAEQVATQQKSLMALAEASAERLTHGMGAPAEKFELAVEGVDGNFEYASQWNEVWQIMKKNPGMLHDKPCMKLLKASITHEVAKGPTCANPHCRQDGHTLAFCPCPVDMEQGDMVGCFFCNVVEHEADDCPLMQSMTVYSLIAYLIANRAGLPPWRTRLDWVAIAIDCWDIVDMHNLPLTREYVVSSYIPKKLWIGAEDWAGSRSPYEDPLFRGHVDVHKLRELAKPKKGKGVQVKCPHGHKLERPPLMESSLVGCYGCEGQDHHYVLANKWIKKYIPDQATVDKQFELNEEHNHGHASSMTPEAAFNAAQQDLAKKQPKSVNKVRMGRRAAKKAADVAAAAEAEFAGPSTFTSAGPSSSSTQQKQNDETKTNGNTTAGPSSKKTDSEADSKNNAKSKNEENKKPVDKNSHMAIIDPSSACENEDELPVSERLLNMSGEFDKIVEGLRAIGLGHLVKDD